MTTLASPQPTGITASIPTGMPGLAAKQCTRSPQALLRGLIAKVRQLSEDGELPLFAWTLGLPQAALARMLEECLLPSSAVTALDSKGFARIEQLTPKTFHQLRLMLFQHRTRLIDPADADYLSRTLASACFGNRQLWQDLGLDSEEKLAAFMATFFVPLAQKHKHCRHWKRQLFKELHKPADAGFSIPDLLLKCVMMRQ